MAEHSGEKAGSYSMRISPGPTTIHQKTYVDERYKITIYYQQTYGEIFDLQEDPKELNNLWDHPDY